MSNKYCPNCGTVMNDNKVDSLAKNPPEIRKKVVKLILKANKTANTLKKYSPDDDFIVGLILSLRIDLHLINDLMQQKVWWEYEDLDREPVYTKQESKEIVKKAKEYEQVSLFEED